MSPATRPAMSHQAESATSHADAVSIYRAMLEIRRFEEKLGQLVALGLVAETGALAPGKEAVAVAIASASETGEPFVTALGPHAALLAKGAKPAALFRCLITGGSLAALGSDCAAVLERSSRQALDTALEWGAKRGVAACWIEGGPGSETWLARLIGRMASEKPALVCVLEVPAADDATAFTGLAADHTGLALERVDAIDARRIAIACRDAAARARRGDGPTLVLARVEHFQGHAAAGARKPRSREETDPIARLRARLIAEKIAKESALKELEKAVRESVSAAAMSARDSVDACEPPL